MYQSVCSLSKMRLCFGFTLVILLIASACGDEESTEKGTTIDDRSVDVYATDDPEVGNKVLIWKAGEPVNITLGEINAVYCVLKDPNGNTVFDGFGQCRIVLERVTIHHEATWTKYVAYPGSVLLQKEKLYVMVFTRDSYTSIVKTTVEKIHPSVTLTCSVPVQYNVEACHFRSPHGKVLIAGHQIGHDTSDGESYNYESKVYSNRCLLHISRPVVSDLGIWRCAVQTWTGTHYGFLLAVCPVAMEVDEVQEAVVTEPVLQSSNVSSFEGDSFTMSCSANAGLRYCFFRASNGTTYNLYPSTPSTANFEYVGAGFQAGECGIRFPAASFRDSREWTCHVGLYNRTAPELRAAFRVNVTTRMSVRHYYGMNNEVVVQGRLSDEHPLDYCRFLRNDGFGFTTDNLPPGFEVDSERDRGLCTLSITDPSLQNLHPWEVVFKLAGENSEISMVTTDNLWWVFVPVFPSRSWTKLLWLLLIPAFIFIGAMCFACSRKKNRQWVSRRAKWVKMSFRKNNTPVVVKPSVAYPVEVKKIPIQSGV